MMHWFQIPRRATHCLRCRTNFTPGSEYFSSLEENSREDHCPSCFKNRGQIFWKGAVPARREIINKNEEALELLREIHREEKEMAFILALFLIRQKVLLKRQELEGHLICEVCETEEILTIEQVDVTKIEVEALQKEIVERLNGAKVR